MIKVKGLIWDEWNKEHIAKHRLLPEEIEEVCRGKHKTIDSYRKRILVVGKTKLGKVVCIVLSPEDRNLKFYGNNIYYPITAFIKEVEK